jgi:hypothetical protein
VPKIRPGLVSHGKRQYLFTFTYDILYLSLGSYTSNSINLSAAVGEVVK